MAYPTWPVTLGYREKPLPLLEGLPAVLSEVSEGARVITGSPWPCGQQEGALCPPDGPGGSGPGLPCSVTAVPPPPNQMTSQVPNFKVTQEVERGFVSSASMTCSPAAEGETPVTSALCGCLDLPGVGQWVGLELKNQEDRTTHKGPVRYRYEEKLH